MAAMEGVTIAAAQDQQQPPPARVVERLNPALQQQLNLDSVKTRAISLFKAISRILEDFDTIARTNAVPKWQDILGQFSMVNLELYNIVEDIKNVSKAFVVHPKNVNAENATILPVMLSSKLLPEMEMDDNTKREQLLHGMQTLPVAAQIEKLKTRIDMIGAACESAEKIIADARKAYFGTRQGPTLLPTIDKVQAAKIQEQENSLRSAVNHGEGMYQKSTPPLLSTASNNSQGPLLQNQLPQLHDMASQTQQKYQSIPNMSAMMPSQSILPRMQFGISGGNRTLPTQNLSDQMFNMGATNAGSMMPIQQQQQQHGTQGAFGNMQSAQNLQPGMLPMQNTPQNHPNFQQQRPQNQQ
ncbi:UNVERIFIED_CONTAM: Mediator of RNA polymerase II transcription subunit [Sesamum radiatum]|uniref:Mediator of RNA polymerase II transcription subunit n=1 Tax=Sesamum radiatum TaxID=300843 RepID=A0AAW2PDU4_SESRA